MTLTDHDQPQAATAWDEPAGLTTRIAVRRGQRNVH
jgi:hypothetical protein